MSTSSEPPAADDATIKAAIADAHLPSLIASAAARCKSHLVQVIRHETTAAYYAVARQDHAAVAYLHPDSSSD